MNERPRRRVFTPAQSLALLALVSSSCVDVHVAPSCISVAAVADAAVTTIGPGTAGDAATLDAALPSAVPSTPDAAVAIEGGQPDSQVTATGRLFVGDPSCDVPGFKLLGSIDGKPVDEQALIGWATSPQAQTLSTYYGNESDGGVINNMRLTWSELLVAGQITPIHDGTLRNVVADQSATYCVTAGEIGLPPMQPTQAVSYQLRITGVQTSLSAGCTGPVLTADLRGCLRQNVMF